MERIERAPESRKVILILILFHVAGLIGLLVPVLQSFFIQLVPFSMLFLVALLAYINLPDRQLFFIFLFGVFICGFLVEVLGVHSGNIFGKHQFGETLGLKLAAVPLLMGFFIVILIYSVGQLMYLFSIKGTFLKALAGSALIVLFDYFLEPVAARLNYWHWENNKIPVQNYIAWFVLSFVLLQFFYALRLPHKKYTGATLFTAQFILFIALYLW
ncbi:MAG: carotenoid biosynthesis protein, partial [Sphingobacteriales bacterium]